MCMVKAEHYFDKTEFMPIRLFLHTLQQSHEKHIKSLTNQEPYNMKSVQQMFNRGTLPLKWLFLYPTTD